MNTTKIISSGNRAVVINKQETEGEVTVYANLYVNTRGNVEGNRLIDGDITLTRWEGKTMKGAEKFAAKVLN